MWSTISSIYVRHVSCGHKSNTGLQRRSLPGCVLRVTLAVLSCSTAAWAGVHTQGVHTQGVHTQGTDADWLRGPSLMATLGDDTTVEIVHFAGDEIHALVFAPTTAEPTLSVLAPDDLLGMLWLETQCDDTSCVQREYRIDRVTRDASTSTMPSHADNGDVPLYRLEFRQPGTDSGPDDGVDGWMPVCAPDDSDDGMGLFVDGRFDTDGSWHADGYTFSCARGTVAKCVRAWGYKPWRTVATPVYGEVDMRPLHLACTRAARAEYCGDGVSYTRDGTLIDMFDIYGLNVRESPTGFSEESTWSTGGAVSLHHPRVVGQAGRVPMCHAAESHTGDESAVIEVWSQPGAM